jgi:hypothetical protein
MLSFIKKLFGNKSVEATAPYKVEASTAKVGEFPFPEINPAKAVKKPAVKKPAVKAKTARKPRAPKA